MHEKAAIAAMNQSSRAGKKNVKREIPLHLTSPSPSPLTAPSHWDRFLKRSVGTKQWGLQD